MLNTRVVGMTHHDIDIEIEAPDVDTYGSTRSRKVRVSKSEDFMAHAVVDAILPLPADAAWSMLTHDENYKIFKGISVRFLRMLRSPVLGLALLSRCHGGPFG